MYKKHYDVAPMWNILKITLFCAVETLIYYHILFEHLLYQSVNSCSGSNNLPWHSPRRKYFCSGLGLNNLPGHSTRRKYICSGLGLYNLPGHSTHRKYICSGLGLNNLLWHSTHRKYICSGFNLSCLMQMSLALNTIFTYPCQMPFAMKFHLPLNKLPPNKCHSPGTNFTYTGQNFACPGLYVMFLSW